MSRTHRDNELWQRTIRWYAEEWFSGWMGSQPYMYKLLIEVPRGAFEPRMVAYQCEKFGLSNESQLSGSTYDETLEMTSCEVCIRNISRLRRLWP